MSSCLSLPNSHIVTPLISTLPKSPRAVAAAGESNMAVNSLRVAAVQMTSVNDLAANFTTCSRFVKEAAASGAKLSCFPESFSFIGAKDGEFDVDKPGGRSFKESSFTEAGKNVVAVGSPVGRLGLTVCYDLRFPEIYQLLRFQHEAQILLVPSAFTKVTGQAHWEFLLHVCAIETQCYVIASAQAGKHSDKRESYDETLIIDPWGTVVGRLPDKLSTGITVADIDFSLIDSVRAKMPIAKHRKPVGFWKSASL